MDGAREGLRRGVLPPRPAAARIAVGYLDDPSGPADARPGRHLQEQALHRAAEVRGCTIGQVFTAGDALDDEGRPGLDCALAVLEAGQAGVLLVHDMRCLGTSLLGFSDFIAAAAVAPWNLIVVSPEIDLETPGGAHFASIVSAAAMWERRVISDRTRDALTRSKAQGVRLGRPPETSAETIRLARRLRESGLSLRRVAAELADRGIPTARGGVWHPNTVRNLLASSHPDELGAERPEGSDDLHRCQAEGERLPPLAGT